MDASELLPQVRALQRENPMLKLLISVGGWCVRLCLSAAGEQLCPVRLQLCPVRPAGAATPPLVLLVPSARWW
jgi:hypothetical protein